MIFHETNIPGAWLIDVEERVDERGFFARSFCRREFEERGLNPEVAQCNVSFNRHRGTLRGLHSQAPGFEEDKLVRCTQGAIYDVILDLRKGSEAFLKHLAVELSADRRSALYVPKGVFHGFLTLTDDAEVFYQMSEFFVPNQALGVRYNDPAFGIDWPEEVTVISDKDAGYPDFVVSEREGL